MCNPTNEGTPVSNNATKLSPVGAELIHAFEKCWRPHRTRPGYFVPYIDAVGVLTIGWGHTNAGPPYFNSKTVWSQQQCDEAFMMDVARFEKLVLSRAKRPLKQHEFDALVSWAYNTGGGNSSSLVWQAVNRLGTLGDAMVPTALKAWNKGTVNGKRVVLNGLVRRRDAEALLFQGNIQQALKVAKQ